MKHLLSICDRFAPGTSDLVVDAMPLPPPKIEKHFGITRGHIHHVDNQFGFADRLPYATPIAGLYSASAGTHPAGSVIGCAGHNAAMRVLRDLGAPGRLDAGPSARTRARCSRRSSTRRTGCSPSAATSRPSACSSRTGRGSSPGTTRACRSSGTRPIRAASCPSTAFTSAARSAQRRGPGHIRDPLRHGVRARDPRLPEDARARARTERGSPRRWRARTCVLHRMGYAHSIEAWRDGELAGGLYGVSLGRVFFGESMFAWKPNASKVALVRLAERVARLGVSVHRRAGADSSHGRDGRRGVAAHARSSRCSAASSRHPTRRGSWAADEPPLRGR